MTEKTAQQLIKEVREWLGDGWETSMERHDAVAKLAEAERLIARDEAGRTVSNPSYMRLRAAVEEALRPTHDRTITLLMRFEALRDALRKALEA